MIHRHLVLLQTLLWIGLPILLFGQKSSIHYVILPSGTHQQLPEFMPLKGSIESGEELPDLLQNLISRLQHHGYLGASVDSYAIEGNEAVIFLTTGKRYLWKSFRTGSIPEEYISRLNIRTKDFSGKPFDVERLNRLKLRILNMAENNGYPFARIWLDSVVIDDNYISGILKLDQGRLILFDTIARHGTATVSQNYLKGYLGIKPGEPYDESKVQKIDRLINDLPFLEATQPANVEFSRDRATVHLYLRSKKVNSFDLLLGFLPNSRATGKLLITGKAHLLLVNPFGTGKEFEIEWEKTAVKTQKLNTRITYPCILGLPFGFDGNFSLYKRDTSYIDLSAGAGIHYRFSGSSSFKGFYQYSQTNVLHTDTSAVRQSKQLPAIHDLNRSMYGLEFQLSRLDYRLNPVNGYIIGISGAAGLKKIKKNDQIIKLTDPEVPGGNFGYLYDSIKLKSLSLEFRYRLMKFWKITPRNTLLTGVQGGMMFAENIFKNEVFRIGGNKLLRGFDEESIFAVRYHMITVEYRFLLDKNSYLNLFCDAAYTEDISETTYRYDWPVGFGAGIAFETKAGMFALSYALGRQKQIPVNFRTAKIHLGYINYF